MNLRHAENTARDLIAEHLGPTWSFRWDNAKRRIGQCWHLDRRIQLSRPLVELNSVEEVLDTILHEIAHGLVGVEHDHDRVWKAKARELGCSPKASANSIVLPPKPWIAVCEGCGRSFERYRRDRNRGHCGISLEFVRNTPQVRPKPLPWSPKLDF